MHACNNCDARLTQAYVRVFGDNQHEVDGCLHCQSPTARDRSKTSSDTRVIS